MTMIDHGSFFSIFFCVVMVENSGFHVTLKKVTISYPIFFIGGVCDAWAEFNFHTPQRDFASQFILNNNCIKADKRVVNYEVLKQCSAYKVDDYFNVESKVIPYKNFVNK